ncbi:MAG: prepilin-type N-terminal cleavage/methylation domain-containing protein [Usitatibacter sp.]
MKRQQSGFTLVEIAIVLVIIGLLLGGILKGQELINSAKVKNLANDFRVIPTYIYAYQDKYKSLPGDDAQASNHLTAVTGGGTIHPGNGNGLIDGTVFPPTSEALEFWMQVRLANLAAGTTLQTDPSYIPTNAVGGQISVTSMAAGQPLITGMTGTYQVCSRGILGKFAKQLDIQMDDGNTATGSLQVIADPGGTGTVSATTPVATASVTDPDPFIVCVTF